MVCVVLVTPSFSQLAQPEIKINVPSRTLQIVQGGRIIREYSVGVGNSRKLMTPPGAYRVEKKIINPVWEHPYKEKGAVRIGEGSRNPLGTRWIGFHSKGDGVFGIHGTNEPNSIGRFVSHGCVRMHNEEVEELFEIVRVGTPVLVTYERFRLNQVDNSVLLEVFPDPYGYKQLSEVEIVNSILRIDPNAKIDYEMISQAIKDTSETVLYEVATVNYSTNLVNQFSPRYFSNRPNFYSVPPENLLPPIWSYSYPPTIFPIYNYSPLANIPFWETSIHNF